LQEIHGEELTTITIAKGGTMKKVAVIVLFGFVALLLAASSADAQVNWIVGMRLGMSLASGGKEVEFNQQTFQFEEKTSVKAGLQFGPMGEVIFNKNLAVVTAFNINTQAGTPIEWQNLFKYYFLIPGSKIKPYADAGFSLWFVTGGPYVGIPFGGGAMFPVAKNIYIPADLQFGPIFGTGTTVFGIEITSGVRFEF
jgi:hypothetical protein